MAGKVFAVLLIFAKLLHIFGASECNLCESLLNKADQCAFLLDEGLSESPPWSCPPIFPCSPIIAINFTFFLNGRAIVELQKEKKCRKFILNTQNFSRYSEIFNNAGKFAPHTQIILLEGGNGEAYVFTEEQINAMYYNAIHVVQIYQSSVEITLKLILSGNTAVGTRMSIPNINSILPQDQLHPLIDNEYSRNEINVSLYNYPPYVLDKNLTSTDNEGTLDIRRFHGIEINLLAGITKKWKRRFYVKRESPDFVDKTSQVIVDLLKKRTNVAIAGLWLIEDIEAYLEVSYPYGQECIDLLVPRQPAIPRGHYVYLAFHYGLWVIYTALIIFISLLIYFFGKINTDSNQFNLLIESAMHVVAIATQHGVKYFPSRYSARVLIMAWILFSFLLGAIYSTGYTSILTTSIFPKPISTIRDVIDKKIRWGDVGLRLKRELLKSRQPEYIEFAQYRIDSDSEEAKKLLNSINYALAVSVLTGNWVTRTPRFRNVSAQYHVMGKCIYKFYTVFAFQPNSPYVELFNREIPKYVESGLIQHWLKLYSIRYGNNFMRTFFIASKDIVREPNKLSVGSIIIGLYILAVGLILATGVFIAELWYFHKWSKTTHSDKAFA